MKGGSIMSDTNFKGSYADAKMSPPWISYWRKLVELFKGDPQVSVAYIVTTCPEVKVYVDNADKADAIAELLPSVKEFGNVTLKITVIPINVKVVSRVNLFRRAFDGNKNVTLITDATDADPLLSNIHYVVFKGDVVQYYDDNLGDAYGNRNTLYQDLAKDVFGETEGVFFCTEKL